MPSASQRNTKQGKTMKNLGAVLLGLIALIYLLNPTAGVFELIPDNIPLIGNLDEAGAMTLLLICLRYFGYELPDIFKAKNRDE
jgi:uncharacterized membrane protein YkvA (DUF1232 family)